MTEQTNEFKFACPHCGQTLLAEQGWAGMKMSCPTCGKELIVPHITWSARCPHCGTEYEVDESEDGNTCQCSVCNKQFTVHKAQVVENAEEHEKATTAQKKKRYCPNCGNQIDRGMTFCAQCGAQVGGRSRAPVARGEIKSHMVGAILQLIVCLPAGIVPLIYASQVNSKLAQGDIAGAQEASNKASLWINIGTAIVGTLLVLGLIGSIMNS